MPTKRFIELKDGILYIAGYENIPDFGPIDTQEIYYNNKHKLIKIIPCHSKCSLTYNVRFDSEKYWRLTGLWKWVYDNCPNRRVRHLLMYGKTKRIRIKNFIRGVKIIGNIVEN